MFWFCSSYCTLYPCFFFLHPIYYLRAFSFSFSLPRRNSDPGPLSRLSSPSPLRYMPLVLSREYFSLFFPGSLEIKLSTFILMQDNSCFPIFSETMWQLTSMLSSRALPPVSSPDEDEAAALASALSKSAMVVLVEARLDHTSFARSAVDGSPRHASTWIRQGKQRQRQRQRTSTLDTQAMEYKRATHSGK